MNTSVQQSGRDERAVDALYHHLIFPPKLPPREDGDLDGIAIELNKRARQAADAMSVLSDKLSNERKDPAAAGEGETPITDEQLEEVKGHLKIWKDVSTSLKQSHDLTVLGRVDRESLQNVIRTLASSEDELFILLHVAAQNCGILIYRSNG
jgi:hypothetical protein